MRRARISSILEPLASDLVRRFLLLAALLVPTVSAAQSAAPGAPSLGVPRHDASPSSRFMVPATGREAAELRSLGLPGLPERTGLHARARSRPSTSARFLSAAQDTTQQGRNVFKDFGGGVVSLGRDALDFITEPFNLSGRQWVEVGVVVGAGVVLAAFDQQIHDFIIGSQDEAPWSTIKDVGDFFEPLGLMNNTNPFWLAGIGVTYAFKQEPAMRVFQQLLFSHLVSGATMVVPRTLIGRVRPRNSPDDPYVFRPFDGTSFPSGHASTIFEVARVVSNALDWWPATAALYGMAGTVAYQRMVEETDPETGEVTKGAPHWPSDVYFGAWYGVVAANIVIRNDEPDANPNIRTGIDPGTGALQLQVRYTF
jgi:hypothetical protein